MKDFKEIRHNNGIVDDSFGHAKIQPLEISRINNCQKETALAVIEPLETWLREKITDAKERMKSSPAMFEVGRIYYDTYNKMLSKLTKLKQQIK